MQIHKQMLDLGLERVEPNISNLIACSAKSQETSMKLSQLLVMTNDGVVHSRGALNRLRVWAARRRMSC